MTLGEVVWGCQQTRGRLKEHYYRWGFEPLWWLVGAASKVVSVGAFPSSHIHWILSHDDLQTSAPTCFPVFLQTSARFLNRGLYTRTSFFSVTHRSSSTQLNSPKLVKRVGWGVCVCVHACMYVCICMRAHVCRMELIRASIASLR